MVVHCIQTSWPLAVWDAEISLRLKLYLLGHSKHYIVLSQNTSASQPACFHVRLSPNYHTLDYLGKEEEEETESTGGLDSSALAARSPPTLPPPPAYRAPAPPRWPWLPVELLDTAEQEALDALWAAAHFHD